MSYKEKVRLFLIKYKWFLIPIIPTVFFLTLLVLLQQITSDEVPNTPNVKITTIPKKTTVKPTSRLEKDGILLPAYLSDNYAPEYGSDGDDHDDENPIDIRTLDNGDVQYTYISSDPNRANIKIKRNDRFRFNRIVVSEVPMNSNDFIELYGDPEEVFSGSRYYGDDVEVNIYARLGFANIVSADGIVLEQHLFEPRTVDSYIQEFGEDIPSQN